MARQAPFDRAAILDQVKKGDHGRVMVAVTDIDGILRGKYMHASGLASALDGGFGFNVFGTDVNDRPYDAPHVSGRRLGFPDAHVRLDPRTFRSVPWDGDVSTSSLISARRPRAGRRRMARRHGRSRRA
jgi:glutamine synthetase